MKVKEIIEILGVEPEKLINQLDNVGIEADLDTEIPQDVIKKLSKLYKKDIKPIKAKKSVETPVEVTKGTKDENQVEAKNEAKKEELKEVKKEQTKKETPVKKEQPKKEEKVKVEPEVKKEDKKEEKVEVQEELELSRVYDDKYIDFEEEKKPHTRIKNVKKNKAKSTGNRKANVPQEKQEGEKVLYYKAGMTVAAVADGLKLSIGEVVKKLVMLGFMVSASDIVERDVAELVAEDTGFKLKDEIMKLLNERDGLALGICNGFQALIKLGLVPYGEIRDQKEDSPTLTMNSIGRHQSKMVYTKVVTNKSPWLQKATLGGVYTVPISHGEGRFVASKEWIDKLFANGQVATQYVDIDGNPTMNEDYNVNGSYAAIEGITSPDGRILGKMAHSERRDNSVAINIYGDQNQLIFESGVEYFK